MYFECILNVVLAEIADLLKALATELGLDANAHVGAHVDHVAAGPTCRPSWAAKRSSAGRICSLNSESF